MPKKKKETELDNMESDENPESETTADLDENTEPDVILEKDEITEEAEKVESEELIKEFMELQKNIEAEENEDNGETEEDEETEGIIKIGEIEKDNKTNKPKRTVNPGKPDRLRRKPAILTVDAGDKIESEEDKENTLWHEIQNAYRTRKILSGNISGLETTETGGVITVVDYKDLRVAIPLDETVALDDPDYINAFGGIQERLSKIAGSMLGADIDFIIKGIDNKSRSIVASRKEAMLRKRKIFYFDLDDSEKPKISAGSIVQARILSATERGLRIEAFGAECPIFSRFLSYAWLGDVRDRYKVGDKILVKITKITGDSPEKLSIQANIKGAMPNTTAEDLKKCREQGKYAGKVIEIFNGIVFIRLNVGVNAVAHSCRDERMPGKKDIVAFVVTKIDEEKRVAVGMITKIIRQHV